jgi:hypothetical protein
MLGKLRNRLILGVGIASFVLLCTIGAHSPGDESEALEPARGEAVAITEEAAALPPPRRPAFRLGYVPAIPTSRLGARFAAVLVAGPAARSEFTGRTSRAYSPVAFRTGASACATRTSCASAT